VVLHLAAKHSRENVKLFKGLVVESTFTSISDMADNLFSFLKHLQWAKKIILRLKWENNIEVKDVAYPILFISGSADTFVPTW